MYYRDRSRISRLRLDQTLFADPCQLSVSLYLLALSFTSVVVIFYRTSWCGSDKTTMESKLWESTATWDEANATSIRQSSTTNVYIKSQQKIVHYSIFFPFSLGCKCFYEQSRDGSQFFFSFFFLAAVEQMINLEKRPDRYWNHLPVVSFWPICHHLLSDRYWQILFLAQHTHTDRWSCAIWHPARCWGGGLGGAAGRVSQFT